MDDLLVVGTLEEVCMVVVACQPVVGTLEEVCMEEGMLVVSCKPEVGTLVV